MAKRRCRKLDSFDGFVMKKNLTGIIKIYFVPVFGTLFIFWLMTSVIFQWGIVPTSSMSPTADAGSIIIGNRLAYITDRPRCGDIIIFKNHEDDDTIVFKRVIGLDGDHIEFKDGTVYRNGSRLIEDYLHDPGASISSVDTYEIPNDSLFVLGDNRQDSADSRTWKNPYIKCTDISSKVFLVIPFGRDCETDKITLL